MAFSPVLSFARQLIHQQVRQGDAVIDATLGNGHDALFLAGLVCPGGCLFGFDIQPEALQNSRDRLADAGYPDSPGIRLLLADHAGMKAHIPAEHHGRIAAVMFNLGYLPGGNHEIKTQPRSTVLALDAALDLLRPGGIATIVVYPGHEGGMQEAEVIIRRAESLPQSKFSVLRYGFINQQNSPSFLLAFAKRPS